jgi:poly-gamma-glutamate capsule biosynthesis protein CapA/YwtB (metallophosphatase superfamily)
MHFGGDVMLGRRYVTPSFPDTVVVTPGDGGTSARFVVRGLAPLFRAASLSSVNVETVVGTFPDSAAYPGKLFTIQSIPEITHLLDELGVDVAVLGNNHIRDWLEPGIASTVAELDAVGLPHVGAGVTEADAALPASIAAGAMTIGILSYSTIDGDSANDNYPLDGDPVPPSVPPEDAFKYEFRLWGFTGPTVTIPAASRRIGSAWVEFEAGETASGDPVEIAAMWASLVSVYPEMQDWLARRGHGGANRISTAKVTADVAALRTAGADLVVVQIHGGHHTYSPFQSAGMDTNSHRAIEAGADLVVGHHPHVHQGAEWYMGKLIVFSVGNCVFDQDFIQTFTTGVLRVVFEETTLLQARMFPVTVHRYAPAPVTGRLAHDVTSLIHERSVVDAHADKFTGGIRQVLDVPHPLSVEPTCTQDRHTLLIGAGATILAPEAVTAEFDTLTVLDTPRLTRSRTPAGASLTDVLLGRDVFRFGHFEDEVADRVAMGGYNWNLPAADAAHKFVDVVPGAPSGLRALRLLRFQTDFSRTRARPVMRINLVDHRLFVDSGGGVATPVDGDPAFTVRFQARYSGAGPTSVILDLHNIDLGQVNEEASTTFIREVELSWAVAADSAWHEVLVDIPASALDPDPSGVVPNQALLYIALYPPPAGLTELQVDDVSFIEWRLATDLPDDFFPFDFVRRNGPGAGIPVTLQRRGP